MKLSVIVPVKDQLQFVQWCLWSLERRTKVSYEIIIVDDLSESKTKNFLVDFANTRENIKYIRNEKQLWHTGSCNRGVKESSGEYICLLNSDAIVSTGWASKMIKILEENDDISCIGPMTSSSASPQQVPDLYEKRFKYKFNDTDSLQDEIERRYKKEFQKAKITGFCLLTSRKKWNEIGEFDSEIPSGGNEADWILRGFKKKYHPVIATKVYCHHFGKMSYSGVLTSKEIGKIWIDGDQTILKKHKKSELEYLDNRLWKKIKLDMNDRSMEILKGHPIDIVTVTYNRMQFAAATIWSIINYTNYPYRLIVVDNASTDGTREWLIDMKKRGYIHELILNKENNGIAESKNQAMEIVNWDCGYCILTDSDIALPLLKPCWLHKYFETMLRHPKLGMLSCDFDKVNANMETQGWWYKQRQTKKNDLDLIVTGFWMTVIPHDVFLKIKEKNNGKTFWGDSLYGEVDAHYREDVQKLDRWVGVQKEVVGVHLGWFDAKFFNAYNLQKKKERFKAEEARRRRDGKDIYQK